MNIILLFTILQLVNVVLSTIKSIITVKGTTLQSALMNMAYYSLYTIIVIYTVSNFGYGKWDLWIKVGIVAVTDFIGVYISAWILNKLKRDKLWEIVATVKFDKISLDRLTVFLRANKISFNMVDTWDKTETIFHIYSKSQKESELIKRNLDREHAKYIVHEESVKL